MVFVNDFAGENDNIIIEKAIENRGKDRIVVISSREPRNGEERTYWLLDRAILLPEDTFIIIRNCKIKLSDRCRDNFFRTANCGMGIEDPQEIKNIYIKGEGMAILEGADHPRATGDSSKNLVRPCPYKDEDLVKYGTWIPQERRQIGKIGFWDKHSYTYGTDAGVEGESQYGDWRNIGILFANAQNFNIENLKIVCSHAWAISLEACSYGTIKQIDFCANMSKEIDGMLHNIENQDGIDIRNGCHDIIISDITGETGDDVIALTAIANNNVSYKGGSLRSTHVMHNDWSRRDKNIHDIIIRNVVARSSLCAVLRLLPANTRIYNIIVDGIIDLADGTTNATLLLGEGDLAYGKNEADGLTNISISNVICNSKRAVRVLGYVKDSVFSNIVNKNKNCPIISIERENGLSNVLMSNMYSPENV